MAEGPSLALAEWLRTLRLDQYTEAFEQSQLRCLQDCQSLTDDSLLRLGPAAWPSQAHPLRVGEGLCRVAVRRSPAASEETHPHETPRLPDLHECRCLPAGARGQAGLGRTK
ncbi:hypothetical protein E2320_005669 [Naja naja]|nr:hypothetical protein E2320_005669 [Naja naja]